MKVNRKKGKLNHKKTTAIQLAMQAAREETKARDKERSQRSASIADKIHSASADQPETEAI